MREEEKRERRRQSKWIKRGAEEQEEKRGEGWWQEITWHKRWIYIGKILREGELERLRVGSRGEKHREETGLCNRYLQY